MVRYPDGRCLDCGERLFARIDGSTRCLNCVSLRALDRDVPDRSVDADDLE